MKQIAKESRFIDAARSRLKLTLAHEHQKFSPASLKRISQAIRSSINRHHPELHLKEREIVVFDENAHTAQVKSGDILALKNTLKAAQKGFSSSKKNASKLSTRRK
jgi:hypothetical protein